MSEDRTAEIERRIGELTGELAALRKANAGTPVADYTFETSSGETTLLDLFGDQDLYCALWPLLALAGLDEGTFTPQFNYWTRPEHLEDGGENVL